MRRLSSHSKVTSSSTATQPAGTNSNNSIDSAVPSQPINPNSKLSRKDFDKASDTGHFIFGTATSAYQHEGGATKGGRGKSIWDDFTLRTPGRIADGSNGNVAVDMFGKYKEDIKVMKSMGFDAYRFSISWPRILPGGRPCLGVNREGIDFYNEIINTLLDNGIAPYVTLFHWDLPHCLELEYGGFLCQDIELTHNRIVNDFREFADLCFWEFGDRVKKWITLNEPWSYSVHGYVDNHFPPGKNFVNTAKSSTYPSTKALDHKPKKNHIGYRNVPALYDDQTLIQTLRQCNINESDSDTCPAKDTYTVSRNMLLCHAMAVDSYKTNFQDHQRGEIGITLVSHWFEPLTDNKEDVEAAKRAIDFMLGWFLEPVLSGKYPDSMIENVPDENLVSFSDKEKRLLEGSIDFLGLNYYTANYAAQDCDPQCEVGYYKDQKVAFSTEKDGRPIGAVAGSPWLFIVPWGIYKLLKHINNTYKDKGLPAIYITENGVDEKNNCRLTSYQACADEQRINYHQDHLAKILEAMNDDCCSSGGKVNVKGYFVWSWADNFEWVEGYSVRFGLMYVDFMNNLTRYPKHSAKWFSKFLHTDGAGKQYHFRTTEIPFKKLTV